MNYIGKKVIVTTSHRGVFFGTLTKEEGDVAFLEDVRMCVSWPMEQRGMVALAASGPVDGCRITEAAPSMRAHGVTALFGVTQEAARRWEAAPWT